MLSTFPLPNGPLDIRQRAYSRDLQRAEIGSRVSLHGSNPEPLMSALGQKRTLRRVSVMSALPPKADIETGTLIA
jgi:hypothetical protein